MKSPRKSNKKEIVINGCIFKVNKKEKNEIENIQRGMIQEDWNKNRLD